MKAVFFEEIKESIFSKRIFIILSIVVLIAFTIFASGFLQIFYLLFFKPSILIPFPISVSYYILFVTIPFLVLLLGYDSISKEIEQRNIRGIISKISRKEYLIGKFLAIFSLVCVINFLLLIGSSIFTTIKLGIIDFVNPLLFFLYLIPYTAALTMITIFASINFTRNSLFIIILIYIIFTYLLISDLLYASIFSYINISLIGLFAFIYYFILFGFANWYIFERKDL